MLQDFCVELYVMRFGASACQLHLVGFIYGTEKPWSPLFKTSIRMGNRTSALTWESSCASRAFSCSSWDGSNCLKMDKWWDRWYHRMHVLMPTLIFNWIKPTKLRGLQSCKVSCNVGILLQKLWDVVQFLVKQRLRLASDLGTVVTHDFRSNDVVAELTGDDV